MEGYDPFLALSEGVNTLVILSTGLRHHSMLLLANISSRFRSVWNDVEEVHCCLDSHESNL